MKKPNLVLMVYFGIVAVFAIISLALVMRHLVLFVFERDGSEFLFDASRILNGHGYNSHFWLFGYMASVAL